MHHSMLGCLCVVDMAVAIDAAGLRVGCPDRPSDGLQHGRGVEGFAQVAGGSGLLDMLEGRDVVMGRDEDDRDGQSFLELEPVHIIHVNVEHEARCLIARQPVEELVAGRECLGLITGRLHDAEERATDRGVIVHDRNDWYIVHDIVHGAVELSNEVVSDPIILRSSGMPVYNYVVVIDDALMKITHVIRGDDHLSNTPKQVALYEALGWPVPEFAHLSTILGVDRERLSKRHGATSIANFRDMGVLPEALVNYLALLGWAPTGGTREIFSMPELIKEFSLQRLTPSSAVFDMEKLYWLNRHYIKASPPDRVEKLAKPYFSQLIGEIFPAPESNETATSSDLQI